MGSTVDDGNKRIPREGLSRTLLEMLTHGRRVRDEGRRQRTTCSPGAPPADGRIWVASARHHRSSQLAVGRFE
jgi:hypothetical protein